MQRPFMLDDQEVRDVENMRAISQEQREVLRTTLAELAHGRDRIRLTHRPALAQVPADKKSCSS